MVGKSGAGIGLEAPAYRRLRVNRGRGKGGRPGAHRRGGAVSEKLASGCRHVALRVSFFGRGGRTPPRNGRLPQADHIRRTRRGAGESTALAAPLPITGFLTSPAGALRHKQANVGQGRGAVSPIPGVSGAAAPPAGHEPPVAKGHCDRLRQHCADETVRVRVRHAKSATRRRCRLVDFCNGVDEATLHHVAAWTMAAPAAVGLPGN